MPHTDPCAEQRAPFTEHFLDPELQMRMATVELQMLSLQVALTLASSHNVLSAQADDLRDLSPLGRR